MNIFSAILLAIITSFELLFLKINIFSKGGIQGIWDKKSDESILYSYEDATDWLDLSMGIMESKTIIRIAEDCIERLEIYILPQMKKRKLSYK